MKERPILFSAPMVRAILDGRKTQTRRVFKHPENYACLTGDCPHTKQTECDAQLASYCKYGQHGDRLWVRESWARPEYSSKTLFKADYNEPLYEDEDCTRLVKWKPSIHLKRELSRITLEVTSVRVERLQDISFEDCEAEGGDLHMPNCGFYGTQKIGYKHVYNSDGVSIDGEPICDCGDYDGKETYAAIWDSINGKAHPWTSNPWVWVIEFRRIKP